MKKRIIASIIALVVLCVVLGIMCDTAFVVAGHINDNYSKEELTTLIKEAQSIKDNAHTMQKKQQLKRQKQLVEQKKLNGQQKQLNIRQLLKFGVI